MIRRLVQAAAFVAVLVLLPQAALAATVNVSMGDNFFSPIQVKPAAGDTVHWSNDGLSFHTTTGDSPLSFWDSGFLSPGSTFDVVFWGAGTYSYHCTIHSGMTGSVAVKASAFPRSGPVGTKFTIKVGSTDAPSPYVFDIQRKDPGGAWHTWLNGVTTGNNTFDSTGFTAGTYQFRARVRNSGNGAASKWSPAASVMVT
jgi:plastocyanin